MKKDIKEGKSKITILDAKTKTVYVKGKGKVTSTGTFNIEGFIDKAMSLPSFWR